MPESPARRRPNRALTGNPRLDSIVNGLREADAALDERVIERRPLRTGRYIVYETDRILRGDGSESSRDIVAVVDSSYRVRPDDMLELRVPLDRIQLFDPDTNFALPFGSVA